MSKVRWNKRGINPQRRGLRLEQASHILDTENVNTLRNELIDKVEVVVEGVLGLLGVGNITAVADDGLADTTGLLRGIDTELQVLCIENV